MIKAVVIPTAFSMGLYWLGVGVLFLAGHPLDPPNYFMGLVVGLGAWLSATVASLWQS